MACVNGESHTITLADDGIVYSFGNNAEGQLGIGTLSTGCSLVPREILNIPKIQMIACGDMFTVLVDYEGFTWSFGQNNYGQLGLGSTEVRYATPQKIPDLPPIHSISCGKNHTLAITVNNNNLWSWGENVGQLCLENKLNQLSPQQTLFSNILQISAGGEFSFFQNDKGEIYGCGNNFFGQLGLGFNEEYTIKPCLLFNQPPNIVKIFAGNHHSLFLDIDGNIFSVGKNIEGNLGRANSKNQNVVHKIRNIPPIYTCSCVGDCSYLLDFDGNIWSFGSNGFYQLGHSKAYYLVPTKITSITNVKQISGGKFGKCFLAKDSQNKIFVMGYNRHGQLGVGHSASLRVPVDLESDNFKIWGDVNQFSRVKSARK